MLLGSAAFAQTRTFQVLDSEGFEHPIPTYRIEIPSNWQAEGKVAWNKPCSGNDHNELILKIQSPDGSTGFRIQPDYHLLWTEGFFSGLDRDLAQMMTAQTEAARNHMRQQFRNSNCHGARVQETEQLLPGLVLNQRPQSTKTAKMTPNTSARQALRQMLVGSSGNMKVRFPPH